MAKIKHYPIKIQVGSNYFFKGYYDDFNPHDNDIIEIIKDDGELPIYRHYHDNETNTCHFIYKDIDKIVLLKWLFDNHDMLSMACLSIGDFNKYYEITIPILKAIRHKIDIKTKKHQYLLKAIDYYIENESFTLTKQQRDELYRMYKKARGLC